MSGPNSTGNVGFSGGQSSSTCGARSLLEGRGGAGQQRTDLRTKSQTLSRLLANQPCATGGEGNFGSESYRDKRLYLKL